MTMTHKINKLEKPGGPQGNFHALFGRSPTFYGHFRADVVTSEWSTRISHHTEHLQWLLLKTPVSQLIFREELVDLQLYYSRTFSQEVFKHMFFKHFKARKYY